MSEPRRQFRYCPRCGSPGRADPVEPVFRCDACGFLYYFNPTVAVGAILRRADRRILLIRRAKDPARGKLAVPGGFIDIGERAEDALRREIREEVNLEVGVLRFLTSQCNKYVYREVTYPVVDLFFVTEAEPGGEATALDGVASLSWQLPAEIDLAEVAFPSVRTALSLYRQEENPAAESSCGSGGLDAPP